MKITESKLRSIIRSVIKENLDGEHDPTMDPDSAEYLDTLDPSSPHFDHASSAYRHPFIEIFEQMCVAWMESTSNEEKRQIQLAAKALHDESGKDVSALRSQLSFCSPVALDAILPAEPRYSVSNPIRR
jgi:hypothetical protein